MQLLIKQTITSKTIKKQMALVNLQISQSIKTLNPLLTLNSWVTLDMVHIVLMITIVHLIITIGAAKKFLQSLLIIHHTNIFVIPHPILLAWDMLDIHILLRLMVQLLLGR